MIGLVLPDPVPQRFGVDVQLLGSRRITGLGSDSRYNRTARSRSSGEYFFVPTMMSFLGLHDQTWFGSLRGSGGTSQCPGRRTPRARSGRVPLLPRSGRGADPCGLRYLMRLGQALR